MEEYREEHMHESLAENDESYIEIELDSCAVTPTYGSSEEEEDKVEDKESEEYDELRISISSTIPLPDDVVDSFNKIETRVTTRDDSSLDVTPTPRDDDDDQPRLKFPAAFDRLFNSKVFWENRQSDQTLISMPFNSYNNNTNLHCSSSTRKEGSITRRNGGIMKMLIKFRRIKLPTLISSLVKPPPRRPPCQDHHQKQSNGKYCRTILQCYHQKNMVINPSASVEEIRSKRGGEATRRWNSRSVVEIDLGALRGMFGIIAQKRRSSSTRKSSSSRAAVSCDNSPIHDGFSASFSDDHNSIQAAIAYCKTSFGKTSDFSF